MPDQVSVPLESYEAVLSTIMELPPPIPVRLAGGEAAALLRLLRIGTELEGMQGGAESDGFVTKVEVDLAGDEQTAAVGGEIASAEVAAETANLSVVISGAMPASVVNAAAAAPDGSSRPNMVLSSLKPAAAPFTPGGVCATPPAASAAASADTAAAAAYTISTTGPVTAPAGAQLASLPVSEVLAEVTMLAEAVAPSEPGPRPLSSRSNSFNIGATAHTVASPVMDIAQNLSPVGSEAQRVRSLGPRPLLAHHRQILLLDLQFLDPGSLLENLWCVCAASNLSLPDVWNYIHTYTYMYVSCTHLCCMIPTYHEVIVFLKSFVQALVLKIKTSGDSQTAKVSEVQHSC